MNFNRKRSENDPNRYNILLLEHQKQKDEEFTITPGYVGAINIDRYCTFICFLSENIPNFLMFFIYKYVQ